MSNLRFHIIVHTHGADVSAVAYQTLPSTVKLSLVSTLPGTTEITVDAPSGRSITLADLRAYLAQRDAQVAALVEAAKVGGMTSADTPPVETV